MQLSILHHDFACGHDLTHWPIIQNNWHPTPHQNHGLVCNENPIEHGASFHALLRILANQSLRRLSLCGFDKAVLLQSLASSGPTLESLRFYVQKECCASDLSIADLALIQQSCPVLARIGITVEWTDLLSSLYPCPQGYLQPPKLFEALSNFEALRTICLFLPGWHGKDWDLRAFELAQIFNNFQQRKRSKPLSFLRIDCHNHVWKLAMLNPSKVLIKSYSRGNLEKGHVVEM
jgi:hypothetical protein